METRRVVVSPATLNPDEAWVTAQTEDFVKRARESGLRVRFIQHDRDGKFPRDFDQALSKQRVKVVRTPRCAPDCQAFVERFIRSLRYECLNHFVFFGLGHLDRVVAAYRSYYLAERPHQGKDNELLLRPNGRGWKSPPQNAAAGQECVALSEIRCHKRLGGLLKHYSRRAA